MPQCEVVGKTKLTPDISAVSVLIVKYINNIFNIFVYRMTEDDINHDVSKNNETYPEGLSPNEIRRLDANDLDKLSPDEQPSIYKSNENTHVISFDNYEDFISDDLIETHSGHIKPDPICDGIMKHELKFLHECCKLKKGRWFNEYF